MPRMRKNLFVLCALVLLTWMGGAVKNSSAQPSDHAHEPVFSQPNGHKHSDENAEADKFYCPMHKHRSLMPCPHKHSKKEMAHPKQCKIAPDCGGRPVKSVPALTGSDYNPASMADSFLLSYPDNFRAVLPLRVAYDSPPPISRKYPPKSL